MELWTSIAPEMRRAFLAACAPGKIFETEISPSTHSTFRVVWEAVPEFAPDLPSMAESLRHALLTQVEGFAITHLKFRYAVGRGEGKASGVVLYKYARLDGVLESVRDIIFNLQKVVFRLDRNLSMAEYDYTFAKKPEPGVRHVFTAEDLHQPHVGVEVLTPDLVLFRCENVPFELRMTLRLEKGLGYTEGKDLARKEQAELKDSGDFLLLPLDADFNPVRKVGFKIDCGGNGPSLLINVETKGNVSPLEAYQQAWKYMFNL